MELKNQIAQAEKVLMRNDKKLGQLIKLQAPIVNLPRPNYFYSLTRSIIAQQVSVAAASAIFARLEKVSQIKPQKITKMSEQDIRALGVSRQKASYIRDLAQHFASNPSVFAHLEKLDDEDIIKELTAIKGIGVWTAQMFLMFTLVRLDVFAPDDIGLQRAIKVLYGWSEIPARSQLEQIAQKWQPYRTVACWHLWQSLQNNPA